MDSSRVKARSRLERTGKAPDRFESEDHAFFERVRGAYLRLAALQPGRVRVIDASGTLENIKKAVEDSILTI